MATVMREIYSLMGYVNHYLEEDSEEDYNPRQLDHMLDILEELHKVKSAYAILPEDFYEKLEKKKSRE